MITLRKAGSPLLLISLLFSTGANAENVPHYLTAQEAPDSLAILPLPPAYDSVDFLRDKAMYDWGVAQRRTPRGRLAWQDANVKAENIPLLFAQAFGYPLSKEQAPEIYRLIVTMKEDAGTWATASAKKHYQRIRPFSFYGVPTCRQEDEKTLAGEGSYPSGHTTIGWALALVLAEINPARQQEILRRGLEIGESRVICGYHWQSDIDAARIMAAAVVARLHAKAEFNQQMEKAKAEFTRLAAGGAQ
ncbi:phosphatase PAP2 family protein [Mixta theicola]|uniref:Acid phosphatase n=1 Tax=Mixta theicola TaxID=1458355 RepID=A0A2K1QF70_9GAMM|nr:phosphatase PAP2 family protein [Mixta theicola]PNS13667.1 phosphatase PAP2 family protein [Mixta theicola]GLR09996.1 acid phosphatase [Mixta theicola]